MEKDFHRDYNEKRQTHVAHKLKVTKFLDDFYEQIIKKYSLDKRTAEYITTYLSEINAITAEKTALYIVDSINTLAGDKRDKCLEEIRQALKALAKLLLEFKLL